MPLRSLEKGRHRSGESTRSASQLFIPEAVMQASAPPTMRRARRHPGTHHLRADADRLGARGAGAGDREGRPAGAIAGAELRGGGVRHQARHAPGIDALAGDIGIVDAGLDRFSAADAGADDRRRALAQARRPRGSPAWAIASAPATSANWVKRSQKGRIAASIWAVGSNALQLRPDADIVAHRALERRAGRPAAALARRRPQRARLPRPAAVTAPRPVMKTRARATVTPRWKSAG